MKTCQVLQDSFSFSFQTYRFHFLSTFQPSVRFEACRGLYRLSLIKENSCLIQLMDALLDSLPLAQSLQSKENSHGRRQEPSAREYFSILCRLVDGLPTVEGGQKVQLDGWFCCVSVLLLLFLAINSVRFGLQFSGCQKNSHSENRGFKENYACIIFKVN